MEKKFVNFTEAMKAFSEGAEVRAWDGDGYYIFHPDYTLQELAVGNGYVTFNELVRMKWTIED